MTVCSKKLELGDGCPPGSKHLGHGPSLGDASTWTKGSIPVEYFAQRPEAMRGDLVPKWLKKALRCPRISVDAQMRYNKGSHQPAPDRPLMIGPVALARASSVVSLITRFSVSEAAKPMRCNQPASTDVHDRFLLLPR